eukprot:1160704-Pelagomonas_calceolata.AAC.8
MESLITWGSAPFKKFSNVGLLSFVYKEAWLDEETVLVALAEMSMLCAFSTICEAMLDATAVLLFEHENNLAPTKQTPSRPADVVTGFLFQRVRTLVSASVWR